MRRLALALLLALAPAAALAMPMGVSLNQSSMLSLPTPIHDVIVGNPTIADVTVADQRHVIITGKQVGVTNLIVRDLAGRVLYSEQIVVGATAANRVALINGPQIVTYACAPNCQPDTPPPVDPFAAFFSALASKNGQSNNGGSATVSVAKVP